MYSGMGARQSAPDCKEFASTMLHDEIPERSDTIYAPETVAEPPDAHAAWEPSDEPWEIGKHRILDAVRFAATIGAADFAYDAESPSSGEEEEEEEREKAEEGAEGCYWASTIRTAAASIGVRTARLYPATLETVRAAVAEGRAVLVGFSDDDDSDTYPAVVFAYDPSRLSILAFRPSETTCVDVPNEQLPLMFSFRVVQP